MMAKIKNYPASFILNSLAIGAIMGALIFAMMAIVTLTSHQDTMAVKYGTDPLSVFWFCIPAALLGALAGLVFGLLGYPGKPDG